MDNKKMMRPRSLAPNLIAPCGMNCGLCVAYLRERNRCPGCNGDDLKKPKTRVQCGIKRCPEVGRDGLCSSCAKLPCALLLRLDKRYRARYGMSMVENLKVIRDVGLEAFVARERSRWKCPECGGVICVHKTACLYCGRIRS